MIKNILFEGYQGPRLSPEVQMARLRRVMENELTETQRRYLEDYVFNGMRMQDIADRYQVYPSTVSRGIRRAIRRCRRCLMY